MQKILGFTFVHVLDVLEDTTFSKSVSDVTDFVLQNQYVFDRDLQTKLYEACEEVSNVYEKHCIKQTKNRLAKQPFVIFYLEPNSELFPVTTNVFAKCNIRRLEDYPEFDLKDFYKMTEVYSQPGKFRFFMFEGSRNDFQFHMNRIREFNSCLEAFRKKNPAFPVAVTDIIPLIHGYSLYFYGDILKMYLSYDKEKEFVFHLDDETEKIGPEESVLCAMERVFDRLYKKKRLTRLYEKPNYHFSSLLFPFLSPSLKKDLIEKLHHFIKPEVLEEKATIHSSTKQKLLYRKINRETFIFEVFGLWVKIYEGDKMIFIGNTFEEMQEKDTAYIKTIVENMHIDDEGDVKKFCPSSRGLLSSENLDNIF